MSEDPVRYASPQTDEEWQEAVNAAHFMLLVDSAVQYGLITYSQRIDVERCQLLLSEGHALGIKPQPLDL